MKHVQNHLKLLVSGLLVAALGTGAILSNKIMKYTSASTVNAVPTLEKSWGIWNEDADSVYLRNVEKSVGIGTENPIGKLDVYGNLSLSGDVAFQNSSGWLHINPNNDFPSGIYAGNTFKTDGTFQVGNSTLVVTENGNFNYNNGLIFGDYANNSVGIGTETPTATLDINGNLNFSGGGTRNITADGPICMGNCL